jgi:hypothetical protein
MTVGKAIATIVGCTVPIAGIGTAAGYWLGTNLPSYYRSVFRDGKDPGFDPVAVGVGQGLTQGLAAGAVVGLIVTWLLFRRDERLLERGASWQGAGPHAPEPASAGRWLLLIAAGVFACGACLAGGLIAGREAGRTDVYHRMFERERESLAPILAADKEATGVELKEYPEGGAYLIGEVPTTEVRDRLRTAVVRAIGERRATDAMAAVRVKK